MGAEERMLEREGFSSPSRPSPIEVEWGKPSILEQFELGELLGEGADMQVFAARDRESGEAVAVKRAHPSLTSRGIHDDVERRTRLQTALRSGGDGGFAGLPRLIALIEPDRFEWYFGDDPGNPYSVQVEARAAGVPLVGSVADQVRGHPVGLPMNLFALHPSGARLARGLENPSLAALGVIERCFELGWLAGDLGPRNVFYSPSSGAATVIDLGALRRPSAATARRAAFDVNDTLFEFFQFYATPDDPPASAGAFAAVSERPRSGGLERMAEALSRAYAGGADKARRDAARSILDRIGRRGYADVSAFRADFEAYLAAAALSPRAAGADAAWREALEGLRAPYWGKFLFEAETLRF